MFSFGGARNEVAHRPETTDSAAFFLCVHTPAHVCLPLCRTDKNNKSALARKGMREHTRRVHCRPSHMRHLVGNSTQRHSSVVAYFEK